MVGEPIQFSYSLHIKHSDATWATRMDHYMNYGKSSLDWQSFIISSVLSITLSLVIFCIMASILNKDFEVLGTMRRHYR